MSRKNQKTVSNLMENIGKCRDILATKDYKEVLTYISLFDRTQIAARRAVTKYTGNEKSEPDFTPDDLAELADDIRNYLEKDFPIVFSYSTFIDILDNKYKEDKLTDNVFRRYTEEVCDYMFVDTKLREAMKILSYAAMLFKVWQANYEGKHQQSDVMYQITQALQSFLMKE